MPPWGGKGEVVEDAARETRAGHAGAGTGTRYPNMCNNAQTVYSDSTGTHR